MGKGSRRCSVIIGNHRCKRQRHKGLAAKALFTQSAVLHVRVQVMTQGNVSH